MSDTVFKPPFLLVLLAVALVSVGILSAINLATEESIQENRLEASRKIFNDIIPPGSTNEIFNDG
jgi:Na+-translocating ferredoxin:NAD+ oxidoreductase RnfG subunit